MSWKARLNEQHDIGNGFLTRLTALFSFDGPSLPLTAVEQSKIKYILPHTNMQVQCLGK